MDQEQQWLPRKFFRERGVYTRNFFRGGSMNSVEDRADRMVIWGGSPLLMDSTQFANE
jgi:hypothetical protein